LDRLRFDRGDYREGHHARARSGRRHRHDPARHRRLHRFVGRALFGYGRTTTGDISEPGTIMSMVFAVIGAIVLLAGYRLIRGRSLRA
jgi:hypothetical protein